MKTGHRIFVTVIFAILLDWLTKVWAKQVLTSPSPVIGQAFRLTLGYNTGVAFGLFANGGIFPLIVTGIIIVGLVIWLVVVFRSGEFPAATHIPIGMILGGAVANFADRLPDGRVTDFLDFGLGAVRWPTFNLADSFIIVGAAILLWTILSIEPADQEQQA
ncbi:MAG: signal peptidase II [Chloroflexi bacterium 44-23]|nr:MAG: signal peptidase II [Chloroflexi bacterium 44-23]